MNISSTLISCPVLFFLWSAWSNTSNIIHENAKIVNNLIYGERYVIQTKAVIHTTVFYLSNSATFFTVFLL